MPQKIFFEKAEGGKSPRSWLSKEGPLPKLRQNRGWARVTGRECRVSPPGHECPGYVGNEKPAEAGSEVRAAHSGAGFTRLFG